MAPPDRRPGRFLTARWVHLAMLNYEVDRSILEGRVPVGTELDSWNGRFFVSMVGFQFLDTRVLGVPIPLHRDFDEVNLRFYVRRKVPNGVRRGVVFIKEVVPRAAIAWLARWLYNENYVALPMRHEDRLSGTSDPSVAYEWRPASRWNRLALRVAGEPYLADDSSEETFITEHYWGYVSQRDGSTVEYQVEHPRWRVWRAVQAELDCEVEALYGLEFADALAAPPSSSFLAEGSNVVVRRGRRLTSGATVTRSTDVK